MAGTPRPSQAGLRCPPCGKHLTKCLESADPGTTHDSPPCPALPLLCHAISGLLQLPASQPGTLRPPAANGAGVPLPRNERPHTPYETTAAVATLSRGCPADLGHRAHGPASDAPRMLTALPEHDHGGPGALPLKPPARSPASGVRQRMPAQLAFQSPPDWGVSACPRRQHPSCQRGRSCPQSQTLHPKASGTTAADSVDAAAWRSPLAWPPCSPPRGPPDLTALRRNRVGRMPPSPPSCRGGLSPR